MEPIKKLGSEWQRIILDVCGLRRPEKEDEISIYQSHLHLDHVALPGDLIDKKAIFKAPGTLVDDLKRKYRKAMRVNPKIQIEEYTDVLKVPHTSYNPKLGKWKSGFSFVFFIKASKGTALVVPECDIPAEIVREYKADVNIVMAFARSRRHQVTFFDYVDVDYIVDNRIWFFTNTDSHTIPKVLFSMTREDIERSKELKITSTTSFKTYLHYL